LQKCRILIFLNPDCLGTIAVQPSSNDKYNRMSNHKTFMD